MKHYMDPRFSPRALRLSVQEAKLRLLELGLEGEAREKELRARLSVWGVLAAALAGATTIFAASGGGGGKDGERGGKRSSASSAVGRAVKTGGRLAAKAGAIALPLVMRKLMSRFEK